MNIIDHIRAAGREGGWWLAVVFVVAAFAVGAWVVNPVDEAADVVTPDGPNVPLHDAEAARGDDMPRGGDVGAALPTSLRPQSYLEDRGIVYKFYPSPNWSERRIGDQVEAIVMHVAAGSCEGMRSWFAKPESQVSAHFGVCKSGAVDQYVEIQGLAWHAGICNRPNQFAAQWCNVGINPNRRTIGIELELKPGERIEDYPQMVASLNVLLRWLLDQHDLQAVRSEIIAHADVDSVNRSVDPHCCASMEEIIAQVANTSSLTPTPTSTPAPTATPVPPTPGPDALAVPPSYAAECWTDAVDSRYSNRWNTCGPAWVFPDGSFYMDGRHYHANGVPK